MVFPDPISGAAPPDPQTPQPEKILLVDDRRANLLVYKTILEDLGQTLITASSGEEALKLVLKHDFAVILLDVNMPTMNGYETAGLIRKRRKSASTPIIFLTAFTDEMNIAQGYASGAVDFLPTPIVPEVLKAKIRVFIELSQMRRQAALQAEERARRRAAEDAAQNFAFLARVLETLARSQSQTDYMRTLVQLPIPHMADAALVWFKSASQPDRIEWADSDGTITASPAALDRLEPDVQRVIDEGRPRIVTDFIGGALAYAQILPLTMKGQVLGVVVLGSRRAQAAISPLASDLAQRAGVVLENVILMEQIREADRRKDEFLGMLAHELRNPLSPIVNCLQLQKMLPAGDARLTSIADTIDRQVRHMGRLIDDLLDATRLAHGKILLRKERVDLGTVLLQTVQDYRSIIDASHLTLVTDVPEAPVWVDGDATRLIQAIGNLLHNAHKFSNPGGTITVRLEAGHTSQMAQISVTDTGIGIEPAMLGHVFDVFRQVEQGLDRSRGGLGLGLALVKGLVQLHGGEVQARSEGLGQGAQFLIRIPVAAALEVVESATAPAATATHARKILIIEDNRDAAETIRMLLQHDGHSVDMAFTAQDGLDKAVAQRPDIILCDIGLPVMDGYQVIRRIREEASLNDTYVIALTGYGREEDQRQALDAGFDLHMTKPIDRATLIAALNASQRNAIGSPLVA